MIIRQKSKSAMLATWLIFIVLSLFSTMSVFSQGKQGNIWCFGSGAGLNFNSGSPVSFTGAQTSNLEGSATISDSAGNLLFYTDGEYVWNRNHGVMATGLMGGNSSTQSGVIVPHPTETDSFFIFTIDEVQHNLNDGLRYTVVDMSLNGGLGGIPTGSKNILLSPSGVKMGEKITAVRHCNNEDIWVVAHGYGSTYGNKFYAYKITANGLVTTPVISSVGTVHNGADQNGLGNARGYMKASPDGSKIAVAICYDGTPVLSGWNQTGQLTASYFTGSFEVFDFNYTTGAVTNPVKLYGTNYKGAYGLEFSPNNKVLYGSTWGAYGSSIKIWQWNLAAGSATAIQNSAYQVATASSGGFGALQIASDGRIYASRYNQTYLSAIAYPNKLGSSCGYTTVAASMGWPRRGQYGLPTFVQSYFDPNLGFSYLGNFEDMITDFIIEDSIRIDSVLWLFDDTCAGQQNSSSSFSPSYTYCDTGDYQVRLIIWKCNIVDTITHTVVIHPRPVASFSISDTLQCFRNNSFAFTNTSTISKGYIAYHKWDFGDGDTSNLESPTHTYSSPGVYTVKLVEKSDKGGYDSISHQVEVLYSPIAFFDVYDSSQCILNNSFNFDNNTYIETSSSLNYYWDLGDGDTFHRAYLPLHSYAAVDSYFVELVVTSDSGCVDTYSRYMYIRPMPNAGYLINDSAQCLSGNSFVFTDTSSVSFGSITQRWHFGDGDSSHQQNPLYSYGDDDTFSVRLIATTNYGCNDTAYHTTYVWPMPESNIKVNDSVQCFYNNQFVFTDSSSIKWGNTTYTWIWDDGDSSYSQHDSHQYTLADTFLVRHYVTSEKQCTDSSFKRIIIHPDPQADFSMNDSSQCLYGNSFIYTNTSSISSGSMNYQWILGDGDSTTTTNSTKSYTSSDTFNVVLISTSNHNCQDTVQKTAYVHPMPQAEFSIDDTIQCLSGNSFLFEDSSMVISGTIDTFFWDFGTGDTSSLQDVLYTYPFADTFSVKHLVSTDFGCRDSISKNIIVHPMPLNLDERAQNTGSINQGLIAYYPLDYNANDSSGRNHNASISGAVASPGIIGGSYYFDGVNDYIEKSYHSDFTPASQSWTVSSWFKATGSGAGVILSWYRCGANPGCGSNDRARYSLEMNSSNNILFKIRDNTSATATNITSPLTYNDNQWHYISGVYDPVQDTMWLYIDNCLAGKTYASLLPLNDGSISVPFSIGRSFITGWGSPTNYFQGYIDEVRVYNRTLSSHEVHTLYKLGRSADIEIENQYTCLNDSTNINLINPQHGIHYQLIHATTSQNIGSSQVSFCEDTLRFSTGSISDTSYFRITAYSPTTGCTSILDTLITIFNYPQPNADFIIDDTSQCISGNVFSFTNLSNISAGSLSYLWDFGDLSNSTATHPTHSYSSVSSYQVKLIATSDNQCKDSISKEVVLRPMPQADFVVNDTSQCLLNNQFNFTDNTSYSYSTHSVSWDFGDGTTSTLSNPSHSYSAAGSYIVKLVSTSDYLCKDSIVKTMIVHPMPIADFRVNDSTQCLSGNIFQFTNQASISSGSFSSSWAFDDGNLSSLSNPVHSYAYHDSFNVELIITSGFACTDTTNQLMIVYPMPQADFTINDSVQCFNEHHLSLTNQSAIPYGSLSYYWTLGDGNSSTTINPTHTYATDDSFVIKLWANSNYGCVDSAEKNVYIHPSPSANFNINDSAQCFNENLFHYTNTSNRAELWYFGDGDTSSQDWPTHTYTTADTFLVTFIAQNESNCYDTSSKTVIAYPSPEVDFSINDSTQCFNEHNFIFTNLSGIQSGSLSHLWNFGDGNTSSSINHSHMYATDDTFQVDLISTSALGCKDTLTKNVYLFPSPVVDIAVNDSQQCFNENSFVFSNTSSINTGTQSYNWTFGDGASSTGIAPTHSYTSDDTFSVQVIATSDLLCRDTAHLTSYVFPSPEPDFSINDSNQCFNEQLFNFTNLSSINTGSQTYRWDFGDGDTSSNLNASHQYATDDTFTVKLFATSDLFCQDSIQKNIYVFPSPQLAISVNDSQQCLNENNFVFSNSSSINSGSQNYYWTFGDGAASSLTAPSHIYNSDDTFNVVMIATSALNCKDTSYLKSYVFPSPQADYSINDSSQCIDGNSFAFTNNSSINSGSISYLWTFGDGGSSTNTHTTNQYTSDDTFNVKLLVTSALGCADSIDKNVYVHPMPVATFVVNDTTQCLSGNNFSFTNNTAINTGTMTYLWSFGDQNSSVQTSPVHSYTTHDTFQVKLMVTSDYACQDSAFSTSYVFPMPEANFIIDDSFQCLSDNDFNYTNLTSINSGSLSYQWLFGDGSGSVLTSPQHSYSSHDTFLVELMATSNLLCQDSIKKYVIVNPMPEATFSIDDSNQCLVGNSFDFTNNSTISSGSLNSFWSFGDSNYSNNTHPLHSYATFDTFEIKLISISLFGCPDSAYKNVVVQPIPKADFWINDSSQCLAGNNYIFTNASTIDHGSMSYLWDFGDGQTSSLTNPSHTYSSPGTYLVKLLTTSGESCPDSTSRYVYVRPMPEALYALYDTSQCFEKNAFGYTNLSSISSGSMTYLWSFGDGTSSTGINPVHSYTYADTFNIKLIATSDYGCKDSISGMTYVHVHPQPDAEFLINDSTQCLRDNLFAFTNTSSIKSGTYSSNWDFGDAAYSNLVDPTHSYTNHDTLSVKLLLISDYGCKDSILHQVYVYPMPDADFVINDSSQCLYANDFQFTNTTTIPWGSLNHEWFFNDGDSANTLNTQHSYNIHDTFDVSLRVYSQLGCMDSASMKAYVHPMPTADFSINDSTQCLRENSFVFTDLSSIASGITHNNWWFGDSDTSLQTHPTHSYSYFDTFSVKMRITSAMGCMDSFEKTTYVFPMPIADFSINDSNQCFNENYFEFTNTSTIPWGSQNFRWDLGDTNTSIQTNTNHVYTQDDTFYVQLISESALGCIDSITQTVYVFPSPKPDFIIDDPKQCLTGNSFTFTNTSTINTGTSTYSWTFGDGNTSTNTSPQHTYNWDDTFQVELIAISDLLCRDTLKKLSYVFPSPTADFSVNDDKQCFNGNYFYFTDASSFDTSKGYLTWRWDFDDGDSSLFQNSGHIFQTDDSFQVELLVWSDLGCYDSVTKEMIVFPNPVAGFDINDSQQCFNGNAFIFSNTTTINTGSMTYAWDLGDGNNASTISPTHTYGYDDSFRVKLVITSDQNCQDSIEKGAYVFPSPKPVFSMNDSQQCFNYNHFIFTNNSSINTGNYNSEWSFGDGDQSLNENTTHSFNTVDSFDVKLILTSNLGCQDSLIHMAYVFPNPVADFSINDSQQCFSTNQFEFTNLSSISTGSMNYQWSFGDASNSFATNPVYSYFLDDTFQVKLIVVSDLNCSDTFEQTTYVFPSPVGRFSIDDNSQCLLDNLFNFTNNSTINSGSIAHHWTFGDGDSSHTKHPSHSYGTYDTFKVKLHLTSDLQCQDSIEKNLYVHPMPDALFSVNDTDQCLAGNNFQFNNLSSLVFGNMNYAWSFGDSRTSTASNPDHSYSAFDTFEVALLVTTANSCRDTFSLPVVVHPMPDADFDINTGSQCLRGNFFEYTNTSSIAYGNISYFWDLGDTTFTTSTDAAHSYTDHGSYVVKLVATSAHMCKDSTNSTVNVRPMPVAHFTVNDSLQCFTGNDFIFTNQSSVASGVLNYYWILDDGTTSTTTDMQHSYNKDTTYTVMLLAYSDVYNCADTMFMPVVVHPMPNADFNFSIPCIGQEIRFTDQSSVANPDLVNQWLWDFKNGDSSTTQNPIHTYASAGTYMVKLLATTDKLCSDSIEHELIIYDYVDPTIIDVATVYDDSEIFVEWEDVSIGRPKTFVLERSTDNINFLHLGDFPAYYFDYNDFDVDVDAYSYIYRVSIVDSCDYQSPYSNIGKTILLTVNNDEEYPILNWTAYEDWASGVLAYELFVKNEKLQVWEPLESIGSNVHSYTDKRTNLNQADYCYKVQAIRAADGKISESNVVCAPTPFNLHVPNSFTPNGDHRNDSFTIKGTFIVEYEIQIFDRWGELMFKSNDITQSWDGTFKGNLCPLGQYYYTIMARGTAAQRARKDGTVLLLR
jgi:gliding motility-associated-like protein